jgi:hypothetical protein
VVYAAARPGWNQAGKERLKEKDDGTPTRIDVEIEPACSWLRSAIRHTERSALPSRAHKDAAHKIVRPPTQENEPMPELMSRSSRERRNFPQEYKRRSEATHQLLDEHNSKHDLDRRLDLALEETFPASDPVSIMIAP